MRFKEIINCKPISPGFAEGDVVNAKTTSELDAAFGKIIIFENTDFLFVTKLAFSRKYRAAILKNGCRTSHIAVLLREGGIPAVSTESKFKDGTLVSVNGSTGKVIVK